jgi:dihydrofolate synthase / folylpolyglutamate synthase
MAKPAEAWIESLSPWPEEFGLERMRTLLRALGDPQTQYPAVHVVGSKGKSTAARTIGALLESAGLRVGVYTSPHVSGWGERIHVAGADADIERVLGRIRAQAEEVGATQFEALTAAAFAEFAAAGIEAAVVEAGLGGRLDATNVLDAKVVLLTNVSLEHTDVLGDTREEIAREKLAVAHLTSVVVLPNDKFAHHVPGRRVVIGGAREAAEAFLERPLPEPPPVRLAGRLERRGAEIRDGAHTPEAVQWLLAQLDRRDYVVCASLLADKDADGVLARLAEAGPTLVATTSSNARALPADELANRARMYFRHVEAVPDPHDALTRARELAAYPDHPLGEDGGPKGRHAEPGRRVAALPPRPVLLTGSLYLLADLHSVP